MCYASRGRISILSVASRSWWRTCRRLAWINFCARSMDMAERSVVGVYYTMAQAEEAVRRLDRAGFPVKHISIVTQNLTSDQTTHGYITPGDDLTARGAITGAWIGGLVSLL